MTTPAEKHSVQHHSHLERRPRLPAIPDLRFERSYLRSIQPFLSYKSSEPSEHPIISHHRVETSESHDFEEVTHEKTNEGRLAVVNVVESKGQVGAGAITVAPTWGDIDSVKWGSLLWITTRDQFISPFLQGAIWALASYYITPFSAQAGSRVGAFVKSRLPTKDGLGVQKLRDWVKGLGITTSHTHSGMR
ncbi:hypothetical protein BDN72DRAFT_805509 [Pluteus cervinus]|uniref:Uncharacterized protein n=1 Tax=Pluteus cervinus TaxID=181527 RepID=A0ACD3A760_9AGAR|nr:hypothetical protein BDN72DRAFT_805509 [Pluteus cervinus]